MLHQDEALRRIRRAGSPGPATASAATGSTSEISPTTDAQFRRHRLDPIALVLLAVLAAGVFVPLNVGIADNGDYTRAMGWVTSGPATIAENWPPPGSEMHRKRFVDYWIPYWKLDWPDQPAILTSTALLWFLGALLNWLFYSRHVLFLPIMSLVPRLALVVFAALAFRWVGSYRGGRKVRIAVRLVVAVPLVLLLMSTQYVRYFNTFYRETGTIIFLLLFLASLIGLARSRHVYRAHLLCGAAVVLLSTAKISNAYWPLLVLPFLLAAPRVGRRTVPALSAFVMAATLTALAFPRSEVGWIRQNAAYQCVYAGLLEFSDNPSRHLSRLGLGDTAGLVGHSSFETGPTSWLLVHPGRLSQLMVLDVLFHEPATGAREMRFAARAMQDLVASDGALGERAEGDRTPLRGWLPQKVWNILKAHIFPRGDTLFPMLAGFAVVFFVGTRGGGFLRELSLVGLMLTLACPIEIAVQVFGAGAPDIARHLLIANFLFDLAVVALLGVLGIRAGELVARLGKRGTAVAA